MGRIRFLHASDLHLGAELSGMGKRAAQRREELLKTLEACVRLCREEAMDFFLLAGDLFDTDAPGEDLVSRVKGLFASVLETEILIAPGNHDYVSARSPYLGKWSENVHIFLPGKTTRYAFPEKNTCVYGAGFSSSYEKESLLRLLKAEPDEEIRLGVLHGDLGGTSAYNPLTEADFRESNLQYVALGHVHQPSVPPLCSGGTLYAYSGCPEPMGFDETGPRGVYVGTVENGKASLEFRPLCKRMYRKETVDLTGLSGTEAIKAAVLSHLRETYGEDFSQHFYTLSLRGECVLGEEAARSLEVQLREILYDCRLRDETVPVGHLERLAEDTSLKGVFVRKMLEKREKASTEEEKRRCEQALAFGLKAFDGGIADYED